MTNEEVLGRARDLFLIVYCGRPQRKGETNGYSQRRRVVKINFEQMVRSGRGVDHDYTMRQRDNKISSMSLVP